MFFPHQPMEISRAWVFRPWPQGMAAWPSYSKGKGSQRSSGRWFFFFLPATLNLRCALDPDLDVGSDLTGRAHAPFSAPRYCGAAALGTNRSAAPFMQ